MLLICRLFNRTVSLRFTAFGLISLMLTSLAQPVWASSPHEDFDAMIKDSPEIAQDSIWNIVKKDSLVFKSETVEGNGVVIYYDAKDYKGENTNFCVKMFKSGKSWILLSTSMGGQAGLSLKSFNIDPSWAYECASANFVQKAVTGKLSGQDFKPDYFKLTVKEKGRYGELTLQQGSSPHPAKYLKFDLSGFDT